jgi:dCTP deaminase
MVYGTLTDREIIDHANRGELISAEFDPNRVRQACYELRASSTYYDLANPDRPRTIGEDEYILLKPKQMLVLITMESIALNASTLGRVLSKGQLFSLGLIPVNTYADPGFTGRLGIVMINASNDYLSIPKATPIAKIEFVALDQPVERPYSGQHGYETEIWPIQTKFKLTGEEIRRDERIGSVVEEVERSYGPGLGSVIKRVFAYERKILLWSAIYFALLIGIIALNFQQEDRLNLWVSVGLGVVTNLVFLTLTLAATNVSWRSIRPRFGRRDAR